MIFKKKVLKLKDVTSERMSTQRERLAVLKQALSASNESLNESTRAAKDVIAEVSAKLKRGVKRFDPKQGLFTAMRDEGVIFVDFRGEIIHVNHAAAELLNRPVAEMMHQRIDYILTGQKQRKISIQECSKLIISKVKTEPEAAYNELCDTARTAYLLKTADMAMHLDEPVCIVLNSGDTIHPLRVVISLLDTAPKELEDITFLCKVSQIVGEPTPVRYSVAEAAAAAKA